MKCSTRRAEFRAARVRCRYFRCRGTQLSRGFVTFLPSFLFRRPFDCYSDQLCETRRSQRYCTSRTTLTRRYFNGNHSLRYSLTIRRMLRSSYEAAKRPTVSRNLANLTFLRSSHPRQNGFATSEERRKGEEQEKKVLASIEHNGRPNARLNVRGGSFVMWTSLA